MADIPRIMADIPREVPTGFGFVTLVDRARTGGCEIIYDGVRVTFPKGVTERPVPEMLAEWLSRVDQQKVHTTDGRFLQRFGVKDASEELAARLGPEALDCSKITVDTSRLEGWDVDQYAPDRGKTQTITLSRRPGDVTNDAAPGGATFVKEK